VRFRYVGLTTEVAQVVDDATSVVLYSVANDLTGVRLFEWDTSSETFYGTNAHHDVTWTADSSGDVSATLRYDPWGNLTDSSGSYLPAFRFQGSWFDPVVDLSWMVTRWYAPALGRFIGEDPMPGLMSEPSTLHLYAYGSSDPVDQLDPMGTMRQAVDGGGRVSYTYRVDGNKDLGAIAYAAVGKFKAWKMLFHANRGVVAEDPDDLVPRGTCIWIPIGWIYPGSNITAATGCVPAHPLPDLKQAFGGQDDWAYWLGIAQARRGLSGIYLMDFTRAWLYRQTQESVGSFRTYNNIWDFSKYQMAYLDTLADAIARYYGKRAATLSYVNEVRVVRGLSAPWCNNNPCTLGQVIFLDGWNTSAEPIVAHEYVHVLQYEGQGVGFLKEYLGDEAYRTIWNAIPDVLNSFPSVPESLLSKLREFSLPQSSNGEEAVPYIWQAFTATSPRYQERPWNIWKTSNVGYYGP
jgi:RHS repeat-associated protein